MTPQPTSSGYSHQTPLATQRLLNPLKVHTRRDTQLAYTYHHSQIDMLKACSIKRYANWHFLIASHTLWLRCVGDPYLLNLNVLRCKVHKGGSPQECPHPQVKQEATDNVCLHFS